MAVALGEGVRAEKDSNACQKYDSHVSASVDPIELATEDLLCIHFLV